MNAISQIDLNETARMLGKSPRQVMRDVEAGKLKATGGGRGVPLAFVKADVEAFNRRRAGIADVDLLARIVHGFAMKRENPRWLNQGFLLLWQWRKNGKENLIEGFIRNGLPPLADVPPAVRTWARQIAKGLTPAEVDYLAALFIVREWPLVNYAPGEKRSLGVSIRKINQAEPLTFVSLQQFQAFTEDEMRTAWNTIESQVRADVPQNFTPGQKKEILDVERDTFFNSWKRKEIPEEEKQCPRAGAWLIFNRYHPMKTLDNTLLDAYWKGGAEDLRSHIEDGEDSNGQPRRAMFPELQDVEGQAPETLLSAASKQKKQAAQQGVGSVRAARVATVLGFSHRFQATRLWRGVKQKIGKQGIAQLVKMLLLQDGELPKAWKTKIGGEK